jgi:hypothetical protein
MFHTGEYLQKEVDFMKTMNTQKKKLLNGAKLNTKALT